VRKFGIKLILFTIAFLILSGYVMDMDSYVKTALGVFLIGSGVVLIILGGVTHFKDS
jgi:multisubunit Na+/H+ antiporter MnhC subunit